MPSLIQTLPSGDINFYRVISSFWGFDLSYPEPDQALAELVESMCDIEYLNSVVGGLDEAALNALDVLFQNGGKMPLPQFSRKYGEIREVGAGKRDRERLYDSPISAAEVLFYRGLIGKGFIKSMDASVEQVFLPDEIIQGMELLGYEVAYTEPESDPQTLQEPEAPPLELAASLPGRSATEAEAEKPLLRDTDLLSELTTVVCAYRNQQAFPQISLTKSEADGLLLGAGIISETGLETNAVKRFLEIDRDQALEMLFRGWLDATRFSELRNVSGIEFEGEWIEPVVQTRSFLLKLFELVPIGKWWNLAAFIRYIKENTPDFQRPAGNYEVWLMKRASDGEYLKGYRHWDEVEGRLIEYFLTRPLRWFKMIDLAGSNGSEVVTAFRVKAKDRAILNEEGKLSVSSNGQIVLQKDSPRVIRYHVSRFCEAPKITREQFIFKVTHASLNRAQDQGLTTEQLVGLLKKNSEQPIPPLFLKTLDRWKKFGIEARFHDVVILRVKSPDVLVELKKTSAARFIKEEISPTTVIVPKDAREKVRLALMEIGVMPEDAPQGEP